MDKDSKKIFESYSSQTYKNTGHDSDRFEDEDLDIVSKKYMKEKDSFDMHVDQLKNTSTEELIEELKDLYRIVADEERVGDYSYDSAKLDIEIIHDILKTRGLDYQKDLAPIWNEIDDEVNGKSEEAEDMSKSPFHYDPSHGLMQAANQINDILKSSYNDEATPEHIEKMALKILGPQSEYRDYHEFNIALLGVKALLNRYVNTEMN